MEHYSEGPGAVYAGGQRGPGDNNSSEACSVRAEATARGKKHAAANSARCGAFFGQSLAATLQPYPALGVCNCNCKRHCHLLCYAVQWIRFAEVVYLRPDSSSSSSASSSAQQQHGGVEEHVVLFVVGDAVAAGRTNPAAVEAIAKAQVGARVRSHGVE